MIDRGSLLNRLRKNPIVQTCLFGRELLQLARRSSNHKELFDAASYFSQWRRDLAGQVAALDRATPWFTYAASAALELLPHQRVFEWGAGGSSRFFLQRAASLVTVEHDAAWGDRVSRALSEEERSRWTLLQIAPVETHNPQPADPSDPMVAASSDRDFLDFDFSAYAAAIDGYPDGHFDLIMVDGRARPSCVRHALAKLSAPGTLILDNSERPNYQRAQEWLRGLGLVERAFDGPVPGATNFSRTSMFQRPRA